MPDDDRPELPTLGAQAYLAAVADHGGDGGSLREPSAHHRCMPLRYRISVRNSTESSQRSRGLLFLAAGVATAWAVHQDHLRVFENGIGAVNLPYLRSQQGAEASKAVHPLTLRMVEDLARAVSGGTFVVDTPAMALMRLQSLTAAGLTGLVPMDIHERRGHDRDFNINAMIWQVTRLRACLDDPEPWRRMVSEFPELTSATGLTQQEVVRLYRAYVEEWGLQRECRAPTRAA